MMLRSISEDRGCAGLEKEMRRARETELGAGPTLGLSGGARHVELDSVRQEQRSRHMHAGVDGARSITGAPVGKRTERRIRNVERARQSRLAESGRRGQAEEIIRTDMGKRESDLHEQRKERRPRRPTMNPFPQQH
jgi:hypothetical protein